MLSLLHQTQFSLHLLTIIWYSLFTIDILETTYKIICCNTFFFEVLFLIFFIPPANQKQRGGSWLCYHAVQSPATPRTGSGNEMEAVKLLWSDGTVGSQQALSSPRSSVNQECCAVSMRMSHKHTQSACHMFGSVWRDTARPKPHVSAPSSGASPPSCWTCSAVHINTDTSWNDLY